MNTETGIKEFRIRKDTLLRLIVHTIRDSFCRGSKTITDMASVHDIRSLISVLFL